MGSRGASSGKKLSPLQAFRENARQFNEAKINALKSGASKLEFTDITGKKVTLFREGSSWRDRPNSMEISAMKTNGVKEKTYKSKFRR